MILDLEYVKRVTKRILTLIISLVRDIFSFQNGNILYAIFDCFYYFTYDRATNKIICKKNKNTKEAKCNNSACFSIWCNSSDY